MTDTEGMQLALAEAERAYTQGEIPIGAVIVADGIVVGRGYNLRETLPDATAHAELIAIRDACRNLGRWRLGDVTLYVTLEPCPMCAGAIVNARIARLVYGAFDVKGGGVDSLFNIATHDGLNHRVDVRSGVEETACAELLRRFFRERRAARQSPSPIDEPAEK